MHTVLTQRFMLVPFSGSSTLLPVTVELPSLIDAPLVVQFSLASFSKRASHFSLPTTAHTMVATESNRADYLWQGTCFEIFIKPLHSNHYIEINVSADGQWNAYHFTDYRQPNIMPPRRLDASPDLVSDIQLQHVSLAISLASLGFTNADGFAMGVSAVICPHRSAQIAAKPATALYFALQHSATQADFHNASDWLIQLAF